MIYVWLKWSKLCINFTLHYYIGDIGKDEEWTKLIENFMYGALDSKSLTKFNYFSIINTKRKPLVNCCNL